MLTRKRLPKFSGTYQNGRYNIKFINTCPLDTWFAVLQCAFMDSPNLDQQINKSLRELYSCILNKNDEKSKFLAANLYKMPVWNNVIDGYSGEFETSVKHLICLLMKHLDSPTCLRTYCIKKECLRVMDSLPSLLSNGNDLLSSKSFISIVQNWFLESRVVNCSEKVVDGTSDDFKYSQTFNG